MITVTTQPTKNSLQAAYLPIPYVITKFGGNSLVPPAIDVIAKNSDTIIGTFPAGMTRRSGSSDIFELDLSGLASAQFDKLAGLPSQSNTQLRTLANSVIELSLELSEYSANDDGLLVLTGNTAETVKCFVIDAYRRAGDPDQNLSAYTVPRFLTRRPRTCVLPINQRDTVTIYMPSSAGQASGGSVSAIFSYYDDSNTLIVTGSITLDSTAGTTVQLPIGPADVESLGVSAPANLNGVSRYTVSVGQVDAVVQEGVDPDVALGDIIDISVSRAPCRQTVLFFYNSFGAWEMALFEESAVRRYDLSASEYARSGRTVTEQRSSRLNLEVRSSTHTAAEADALLDLANAPLIYLSEGGALTAVTLNARTLPVAFGPGSNGTQPFQFTLRAAASTRSQRTY